MIVLNTIVMALEADYPQFAYWTPVNSVFLVFFVVEISLRFMCTGCVGYFTDPKDRWWNIFDFTIVALGVVDAWVVWSLEIITGAEGHDRNTCVKLLMMLRTLRIFRILRTVRLIKQYPELYKMAQGLMDSFTSVIWVAVLFLLWMLICGIVITNVVMDDLSQFEKPEMIEQWFGGVGHSMLTLFVYLTCDDWSTSARIVNKRFPLMELFWITYMFIGAFTLLSLLTGLMADKMNTVREETEELFEDHRASEVKKITDLIMKDLEIFEVHDSRVTPEIFMKILEHDKFQEELRELKIDLQPEEAVVVFKAIDRYCNGWISVEDFAPQLITFSSTLVRTKDVLWCEGALVKVDRVLDRQFGGGTPNSVNGGGSSLPRVHTSDGGFLTATSTSDQQERTWTGRVSALQARSNALSEKVEMIEADILDLMGHAGYTPRLGTSQQVT